MNRNTDSDKETLEVCRTIPLSDDDLVRLSNDGVTPTFEFDGHPNVTLVFDRDRDKWEEHPRPDAEDVVFLSEEDVRLIRRSKTGIQPTDSIRLIREASADE